MNEWVMRAGFDFRGWGWVKKMLMVFSVLLFLGSSFMFLTPAGTNLRAFLAKTVIATQHREWAWIFVGKTEREAMVRRMIDQTDINGAAPQDDRLVHIIPRKSMDELIHVEDISGPRFKGKMMWVYDPKSIRLVVPYRAPGGMQTGERITEMVNRTGAVAGVNAGGFDDPDGLGNGFAPIGMVMSNSEILFGAESGKQPIVGFNDKGFLVVGNYTISELRALQVKEAASFYPRVILDGKPLPVDDGGINPRTAVGQTANGAVIFIIIDGRQFGHSIGATLKDVQDLFMQQGVINAGFLDGGASSEMVVNGKLITKPSSKYGERRLPSAFLVFENPEKYVVENPWAGLTKIDAGGASSHPEFLADLARQREQEARNPKPSAKPSLSPSPSGSPGPADKKPLESAKPGDPTAKPAGGVGGVVPYQGTPSPGGSASPTPGPGAGAGAGLPGTSASPAPAGPISSGAPVGGVVPGTGAAPGPAQPTPSAQPAGTPAPGSPAPAAN